MYQTIIEYIQKHGYSPSIREIGELAGIRSTATVQYYIDELMKIGLLATDAKPGTPRAIRVVGYQYVKITESEEKECQKQE
ncbi:MAG: hypothetical protein UHN47_03520 [Lachnospiraceae bacterium]|nr:hypothetical protein [Lachnospiraceae bacterium]